jgi:protein-S-isoprenylcysteine O-methyltransferase Ste14
MNFRLASLLATLVLVACAGALLWLHALIPREPVLVGVQIAAVTLMLWARVTFGGRSFHAGANPTEGGLVTTGPYRFVRHPIYLAIMLFLWAGAVTHHSIPSLLVRVVATAATAVRIVSEERLVVERYPEYADYARRTKRLIPFVF